MNERNFVTIFLRRRTINCIRYNCYFYCIDSSTITLEATENENRANSFDPAFLDRFGRGCGRNRPSAVLRHSSPSWPVRLAVARVAPEEAGIGRRAARCRRGRWHASCLVDQSRRTSLCRRLQRCTISRRCSWLYRAPRWQPRLHLLVIYLEMPCFPSGTLGKGSYTPCTRQ